MTSTQRRRTSPWRGLRRAVSISLTVAAVGVLAASPVDAGGGIAGYCLSPEVQTTSRSEEVIITNRDVTVYRNGTFVSRTTLDQSLPRIIVHTSGGSDDIDVRAYGRPVVVCTGSGNDRVSSDSLTPTSSISVVAEDDLTAYLGLSTLGQFIDVNDDATIFTLSEATIIVGDNATISTSWFDDEITVGGDAVIDSGGGNDIIRLGNGDDEVDAGAGDDWIVSGDGEDHVDGGPGWDNCDRNISDLPTPMPDYGPDDTYVNCELLDGPVDVEPNGPMLPPGFQPNRPFTLGG